MKWESQFKKGAKLSCSKRKQTPTVASLLKGILIVKASLESEVIHLPQQNPIQ